MNSILPLSSNKRKKYLNITFTIVLEYSNVINCNQTLNVLVIANKKSLELIAKHIKLIVKQATENNWRSDQTNAYIRALRKEEDPL